jgi:hypothetical protein
MACPFSGSLWSDSLVMSNRILKRVRYQRLVCKLARGPGTDVRVERPAARTGRVFLAFSGRPLSDDHGTKGFLQGQGQGSRARRFWPRLHSP